MYNQSAIYKNYRATNSLQVILVGSEICLRKLEQKGHGETSFKQQTPNLRQCNLVAAPKNRRFCQSISDILAAKQYDANSWAVPND